MKGTMDDGDAPKKCSPSLFRGLPASPARLTSPLLSFPATAYLALIRPSTSIHPDTEARFRAYFSRRRKIRKSQRETSRPQRNVEDHVAVAVLFKVRIRLRNGVTRREGRAPCPLFCHLFSLSLGRPSRPCLSCGRSRDILLEATRIDWSRCFVAAAFTFAPLTPSSHLPRARHVAASAERTDGRPTSQSSKDDFPSAAAAFHSVGRFESGHLATNAKIPVRSFVIRCRHIGPLHLSSGSP